MDPLSITASVAGLLTLTVQVITVCDGLYRDVKKRPKGMKDLRNDLVCLVSVLDELKACLSGEIEGEEAALKRCLEGCNAAIKDVRDELAALTILFEKNIVIKAYAQLTFSNKTAAIAESRNRVDKFTTAISIALAVRQGRSSDLVHSKLDKLTEELGRTRGLSSQRKPWLEPLQEYVDASAAVITRSHADSKLSTGGTSASTLVGELASTTNSVQNSPAVDADAIASFGSFDEWLESFALPEEKFDRVSSSDRRPVSSPMIEPPVMPVVEKVYPDKIAIIVKGLPDGSNDSPTTKTEAISLKPTDFWDDVLKVLTQRGHRRICGLRMGTKLFTPLVSHTDAVRVTVTEGPSTYSISKGLQINIDESLESYLDSFVRAGEAGAKALPLQLSKKTTEGKIAIMDHFANTSKELDIAFCRTLRVPEDGVVYNPPLLMSPLPLLSSGDAHSEQLPQLCRKGASVLIPLWQREAMALTFSGPKPKGRRRYQKPRADFAVKIYSGSIDVISGAVNKPAAQDSQDYIIPPHQNRLDGYLLREGIVKQFVAMPLGAGYTAEGQTTGQEILGGVQLLIAPRLRGRGTCVGYDDQRKSPRELDLAAGCHIDVHGDAVTSRAQEFQYHRPDLYFLGTGCGFHDSDEARPRFVHEVLCAEVAPEDILEPLTLQVVHPWVLNIILRHPQDRGQISHGADGRLWPDTVTVDEATLLQECSPFLGINDLARLLARTQGEAEAILFDESGREISLWRGYIPIHEIVSDGGILFCQVYAGTMGIEGAVPTMPSDITPSKKEQRLWDMGLAPGGEIKQGIVTDPEPLSWNWSRARLVNVQIINSVVFHTLTGVAPPPPPIGFKDYVRAKLPFFQLIDEDSLVGGKAVENLQSVAQQDAKLGVMPQNSISHGAKAIGCVVCGEHLADAILKPCMHAFCALCIRDDMQSDNVTRCAACRAIAESVTHFSAPMEFPLGERWRSKEQDCEKMRDTTQSVAIQQSSAPTTDIAKTRNDSSQEDHQVQSHVRINSIDPVTRLQKLVLRRGKHADFEIDSILARGDGHNEPIAWTNGRTAMQIAASVGDGNTIAKLLAANISANEAPSAVNGRTALQAAAERGNLPIVICLLEAGADPNSPVSPSGGISALEAAAAFGDVAILALLFKHGAAVQRMWTGRSALHLAAESGHEAAVALLLKQGCDPDIDIVRPSVVRAQPTSRFGMIQRVPVTPSVLAAERGHLRVLKILRSGGARMIPTAAACAHGQVRILYWLLEILEEQELDQQTQTLDGEFLKPSYDHHLISVDGNDNSSRNKLQTILDSLLNTAAVHGQADILRILVERGARLRQPQHMLASGWVVSTGGNLTYEEESNGRGSTPLHAAASSGSVDTVIYLLSQGFTPDEACVNRGCSPLMKAAEAGKFAVAQCLLENGANVHHKDLGGKSAAMYAAKAGAEDILRLLIANEVDLIEKDDFGATVLSEALSGNHMATVKVVLEQLSKHKAKPDCTRELNAALANATARGLVSVVDELLEFGADPSVGPWDPKYGALYEMSTRVRREANEDDCMTCARMLLARGATITHLEDILEDLVSVGKLRLASWFVDSLVEEDAGIAREVEWPRLILQAVKQEQAQYAEALIRGYRRALGANNGDTLIPRDRKLMAAFSSAVKSGQLEVVEILLMASSKADASLYLAEADRDLGPRDHLRRYLGERYDITPKKPLPELVQMGRELVTIE